MNSLVNTRPLEQALDVRPLPVGTMAGPWRVEGELGRGGMAIVYSVVHEHIGKRAALKVIHQGTDVRRALAEARVVNRVCHPNIVDIFETGTLEDGRPYIVMERLHGITLAHRARADKILPLEVIAILRQIAGALIAAHDAGIVHRDLKTDNVFLIADPSGAPKAKLLDWGIAKELCNDARRTLEGVVVGTPHYISPEQVCGQPATDRTDVYALGVVAFELFVEQLPFEAETVAEILTMHLRKAPPLPRDLWPDIPTSLQDLLLAMLAKDPTRRPSMRMVQTQLDAVAVELSTRRGAGAARGRSCAPEEADAPARWSPRAVRPPLRWLLGAAAVVMTATLVFVAREVESAAADDAAPTPAVTAPVATTPTLDTLVAAAPAAPAANAPAAAPTPAVVATAASKRTPPHHVNVARGHGAKPVVAVARVRHVAQPLDRDGTLTPYP